MRWIVAILLSSAVTTVWGDEYYEFFSIRCAPPVLFASIESVGIWNVGEYVWPVGVPQYDNETQRKSWLTDNWRLHEVNLETLEQKYGLYVFGQAYGRYAAEHIVCENPAYRLHISADPVERRYVNDDDIVVRYRGPMKVRIELRDGRLAFEGVLQQGESIRVDRDEIETCSSPNGEPEKRELKCARRPL